MDWHRTDHRQKRAAGPGVARKSAARTPASGGILALQAAAGNRAIASLVRQHAGQYPAVQRDLKTVETELKKRFNYFRYGVSKAVFNTVDHHAWGRLMRWIRAKYAGKHRLGMKELRRRFCDVGWRFAYNGVVFTGATSVKVTRYRYRGSRIPTPWTIDSAGTPSPACWPCRSPT